MDPTPRSPMRMGSYRSGTSRIGFVVMEAGTRRSPGAAAQYPTSPDPGYAIRLDHAGSGAAPV